MTEITRRDFNKRMAMLAGGMAGAALPLTQSGAASAKKSSKKYGRVVVIGGGVGGISVAKLIRQQAPGIKVTLVEARKNYTSCFFSNHYIAGFRSLQSLNHSYAAVKSTGITLVHDYATAVDHEKKQVLLKGGERLPYDRLILSPGIEIDRGQFEGYTAEAAQTTMPHAWQYGTQSAILRRNLLDMEDGGVVSLVIGRGAQNGRSPYAAYERASLIAHYLKSYKPASKLFIFDSQPGFNLQSLYLESWKKYYPGLLERVGGDTRKGLVTRVDHKAMTLHDGNGTVIKTDVANIVPGQRAGKIAQVAGVTDGDWCPVLPDSFRSTKNPDIYILGDAAQNGFMPRTASAAHSQAQVVANAVIAELAGKKRFPARFRNTCWAVLATNDAIKFGGSYKAGKEKVELTGSFASRVGEDKTIRAKTYKEAQDWYKTISSNLFSKNEA